MTARPRRVPLLVFTALFGLAVAAAAIFARSGGRTTADPGRHLRAVVVDLVGRPSVGEESPAEGTEIPQGRTIVTPTRSGLHIRIGARIDVAIDRGSRVRLVSLRAGSVRLVDYDGSVRVRVRDLPPAEHFAVEAGGRSVETEDATFLAAEDRVTVLDGNVTVNPGEADTRVSAGETWRPATGGGVIDELDARHLAALVAGRPWVLGAPPG